mmetsp:Transcript_10047/g.27320  ORF Transcript_10047/g.27320 Transcript_10047/m.27320 type:complete len:268 (+) Transcript_10047:340-1143(+)
MGRPDAVSSLVRILVVPRVREHHHRVDRVHGAHDDASIWGEGREDDPSPPVAVQLYALHHARDSAPQLFLLYHGVIVLELELQVDANRQGQVPENLLQRRQLVLLPANPRLELLLVKLAHQHDWFLRAHRRHVRELLKLRDGQLPYLLGDDLLGSQVHVVDVVVVPDHRGAVLRHLNIELHEIRAVGRRRVEGKHRVLPHSSGKVAVQRLEVRRAEVASQAPVADHRRRLRHEKLLALVVVLVRRLHGRHLRSRWRRCRIACCRCWV